MDREIVGLPAYTSYGMRYVMYHFARNKKRRLTKSITQKNKTPPKKGRMKARADSDACRGSLYDCLQDGFRIVGMASSKLSRSDSPRDQGTHVNYVRAILRNVIKYDNPPIVTHAIFAFQAYSRLLQHTDNLTWSHKRISNFCHVEEFESIYPKRKRIENI